MKKFSFAAVLLICISFAQSVQASTYFTSVNLDTDNNAPEGIFYDANSVTIKAMNRRGETATQSGLEGDHFGNTDTYEKVRAIAVGDINCDGITDLAIGAPGKDTPDMSLVDAGMVYVYLGGPNFFEHYRDAKYDMAFASSNSYAQFGYWTYIKDYDADGNLELVIETIDGHITPIQFCSKL